MHGFEAHGFFAKTIRCLENAYYTLPNTSNENLMLSFDFSTDYSLEQ